MFVNRFKWILAAVCVACLVAQVAPPNTIRVTTRLVEINAIVRDHKGPVEGLTKEDFTILDNGKPQKIAFFSVNSTRTPQKQPAPLPPNVFTNIPEERHDTVTSATVVLVDTLHTQVFDQPYAKEQFMKFLQQIKPEDRVAVYALGRRITILHDFTNDAQRLLAAVNKYQGSNEGVTEAADPDSSDYSNANFLSSAAEAMQDFATLTSGELTAMALEAIANHLGHMPGRKSLVWITGSIPLRIDQVLKLNHKDANPGVESAAGSGSLLASQTYHAIKALNDANIAVYPVDARGLVGVPASMTAAGARSVTRAQAAQGQSSSGAQIGSSMAATAAHDSMIALAKATGGLAFYNSNDIKGAVRKAVDDSELTYTLGFYPDTGNLDASFHELKVNVDRKGVEIRTRGGYQANPETQTTEKERTDLIRDALWSPLESSAVGLAARVEPVDQPAPGSYKITLIITPADVQFEQKDGKWIGAVDYVLAQRGAGGNFLNREPKGISLSFDQDQYRTLLTQGLSFTNTVKALPGAATLRVVLLDRTSGKVGSVNIPLKR
jgi:VWFA-related protein